MRRKLSQILEPLFFPTYFTASFLSRFSSRKPTQAHTSSFSYQTKIYETRNEMPLCCPLLQTWHSVPVSKRRKAFPSIPSSNFRKIWAQFSSLKHQQRSDKMVSFRDYEIYLLFLLLVKFHWSGKCEIYSPVQRILQWFLLSAILSSDTANGDLLFLGVMFVRLISELQDGFQQLLYFKI